MGVPYDAGFPPDMHIDGNFIIRFTALNATTGLVDTSVSVSNAAILATPLGKGTLDTELFTAGDITWLNVPVEGEGE